MDKKLLIKFEKEGNKIKINLKNGLFYTGYIITIEESSMLFKDKFENEMLIDLGSISYVIPVENGRSNQK